MNAYPAFRPWELDHYSRGELSELLEQLAYFLPTPNVLGPPKETDG